jgi:hypothetical protein
VEVPWEDRVSPKYPKSLSILVVQSILLMMVGASKMVTTVIGRSVVTAYEKWG